MRFRSAWLGVVVMVLTALSVVAPVPADALGLLTGVMAGTCPKPLPYPPPPHARIASSATVVNVGQTIEASGTAYCPDEDVAITIGGKNVGTAHTDSSGAFDPPVVVPAPGGTAQLCGVGASGLARDADCLTLTARTGTNSSASPEPGAGGNNGGGTAFTGVQVALLAALALLLTAGGIAFATAGRANKSTA